MRIDAKQYGGACSCGKTHRMETRLCVIEENALARLETYLEEVGVGGRRCVVYDGNTYQAIPEALRPAAEQEILLPSSGLHADEHSTAEVLERLAPDTELMMAVGGGPVHDIVRYCAKQKGVPFVSIPTAASCDAFSAEVAAMTWNGVKKTINCQAPVLVVADINIIRAAPGHLVLSGTGDVLGKFIALAEWKIAHLLTGEAFCPVIYGLMRDAVERIWANCAKAREGDTEALTAITYGLLLSGIAMQLFGNSRPASGAEHHIGYLIDLRPAGLEVRKGSSHGEQVGVGTLLASAEYHRLAEIEDIAPYVVPYTPIDQEKLRAFWGEALYPGIQAENEQDALAAVDPERLIEAWPEIRRIIAEIPTEAELLEKLTALGAKRSLTDLGVSEEALPLVLDAAPMCRNRLTLMRTRRMIRA